MKAATRAAIGAAGGGKRAVLVVRHAAAAQHEIVDEARSPGPVSKAITVSPSI